MARVAEKASGETRASGTRGGAALGDRARRGLGGATSRPFVAPADSARLEATATEHQAGQLAYLRNNVSRTARQLRREQGNGPNRVAERSEFYGYTGR